jgi:hypothetical protein
MLDDDPVVRWLHSPIVPLATTCERDHSTARGTVAPGCASATRFFAEELGIDRRRCNAFGTRTKNGKRRPCRHSRTPWDTIGSSEDGSSPCLC